MDGSGNGASKALPLGLDAEMEEEYSSLSKSLQEFTKLPTIDKAWAFKSDIGMAVSRVSYKCH